MSDSHNLARECCIGLQLRALCTEEENQRRAVCTHACPCVILGAKMDNESAAPHTHEQEHDAPTHMLENSLCISNFD